MTAKPSFKLAVCVSVGALSLLLTQPVTAEAPPPAQDTAASPAEQAATPSPQAAETAARGFDMPVPPPVPQPAQWMSYEEMQEMMKGQGVDLPPMPAPDQEILPPPPMPPFMAGPNPEQQKRLFDVFESMTPEQQEACFAVARWRSPPMMPPQMPMQMPTGYGYPHGKPLPAPLGNR